MKIFKKIISLILTAAIMMSMVCVGTVNAGAFMTNDGKTIYIEETAPYDISDVAVWTIEYVCPEKNFTIMMLDYGAYWKTVFASGKDTGELTGWLNFKECSVSSSSISHPVSSSTVKIHSIRGCDMFSASSKASS